MADNFGSSSGKRRTKPSEIGTLKCGVDSLSFDRKSKLFVIHPVKENKPNGQKLAAPDGGCKITGENPTGRPTRNRAALASKRSHDADFMSNVSIGD